MPESAEVREQVDTLRQTVGRSIKSVEVVSGRYTKKPIAGFGKLVGYRIANVVCHGKLIVFMFMPPDGSLCPKLAGLSTLGMSGWWVIIAGSQGDKAVDLKHCRLRIQLADYTLCYVDPRNFGTFKLAGHSETKKKVSELGPDIAVHDIAPPELFDRLARYAKKKTIAEALLDQRIFAGVGNYIRADAMYNASIDPRLPALEVPRQRMGQLWADAHAIANTAYHAKYANSCYGRLADAQGRVMSTYRDANGRTVWWCPQKQAA